MAKIVLALAWTCAVFGRRSQVRHGHLQSESGARYIKPLSKTSKKDERNDYLAFLAISLLARNPEYSIYRSRLRKDAPASVFAQPVSRASTLKLAEKPKGNLADLILTEKCENGLAVVTLNNPKALNAANVPMVQAIRTAIEKFKTDDGVRAVLLKGSGGKAFCSGGDVKGIREALVTDSSSSLGKDQVYHEYNLLYEMRYLGKPTISFLEGVTMGFGLGLATSAQFRIATEKTRLAMPENNIGLFPDVGFAYLAANHMPAGIGRLMALSGVHLLGADDALKSNLASSFVEMAKLPDLEAALRSADLSTDALGAIGTCIDGLKTSSPGDGKLEANAPLVARMKDASTLSEAYAALDAADEAWTAEAKTMMQKGSPFSQAVIWSLLQAAEADRELPEPQRISVGLERDYATACRLLYRPDFCEGVRAVLVDKGSTAAWQPATATDVSAEEVATSISDLPDGERKLGLPVAAK